MSGNFRAVAADFDGTLTEGVRPDDTVLETIAALCATGIRVVLATGRILGELRHAFPDVDEHFDGWASLASISSIHSATPAAAARQPLPV